MNFLLIMFKMSYLGNQGHTVQGTIDNFMSDEER